MSLPSEPQAQHFQWPLERAMMRGIWLLGFSWKSRLSLWVTWSMSIKTSGALLKLGAGLGALGTLGTWREHILTSREVSRMCCAARVSCYLLKVEILDIAQ